MKAWIKGGLIGAAVLLILGIILFLLTSNCFGAKGQICADLYGFGNETSVERGTCLYNNFQECNVYSTPLFYSGYFPLIFLIGESNSVYFNAITLDIIVFLDMIITGFILGAIIGLILGKKKRYH